MIMHVYIIPSLQLGFPRGSDDKESAVNAGGPGSISGQGARSQMQQLRPGAAI